MNVKKWITICLLTPFFLICQEPNITAVSEALGTLIGNNLRSITSSLDVEALVRGLKGGCEGKEASLSEEECLLALESLQEKALMQLAEKNLAEATEFLLHNGKEAGVLSFEEGKLQVRIQHEGSGEPVESYSSPLIKYEGKLLNGQIFCSSLGEETLSLDSVIEGLSKGVQGMREGEKRTLYVHPDLGFGAEDPSMPNALLIFEVELLKADLVREAVPLSEQIAG